MADTTPSTTADWLGLDGSRVLVAGAGGIGGACALAYAKAGASVALGADVVFELTVLVGYYATLALQLRVFRVEP